MDENELKEIEARQRRATPGPWVHDLGYGEANLLIDGELKASTNSHAKFGAMSDYDIEFISRAREDVPALIAEVRRFHKIRSMLHVIVRRGMVQYCPFCSSDVRENHSGFCEMFTLEGELK